MRVKYSQPSCKWTPSKKERTGKSGLCYKPSGSSRSPHHYCKFYYSFSFLFYKANNDDEDDDDDDDDVSVSRA